MTDTPRGPWRNRMHSLYMEFCYVDELPSKERQLFMLYGGFFDDHYEYKLAKPSARQVALRCPLGGDAKPEFGDTPRDIRRHNRIPAKLFQKQQYLEVLA